MRARPTPRWGFKGALDMYVCIRIQRGKRGTRYVFEYKGALDMYDMCGDSKGYSIFMYSEFRDVVFEDVVFDNNRLSLILY